MDRTWLRPAHDDQAPSSAAIIQRAIVRWPRNVDVPRAERWPPGRRPAPRPPAGRSAATAQSTADRDALRSIAHAEIVAARPSRHAVELDHLAGLARRQSGRSSDRDRRPGRPRRRRRRRCRNCRSRSSAAHTVRPRRRRPAASQRNARPGGPAVARKRPGDLAPMRALAAAPCARAGPAATPDSVAIATASCDQRAQRMSMTSGVHGSPATARAAPVSSRMCMPVLARSTM